MDLIDLARQKLSAFLRDTNRQESGAGTIYVGTHIRRGDQKSLSYSYPDRKIPLHEYLDGIQSTWTRLHSGHIRKVHPVVYLATDSPQAHVEFSETYKGEVFSLYDSGDSRLRALASPAEYYQKEFNKLDLQSRIAATRGMIVDLALVSGMWADDDDIRPDAVICAMRFVHPLPSLTYAEVRLALRFADWRLWVSGGSELLAISTIWVSLTNKVIVGLILTRKGRSCQYGKLSNYSRMM